MNKEFVTYAQALALKELGFNEPCFGYYNTNTQGKMDHKVIEGLLEWYGDDYQPHNSMLHHSKIAAPLKQQVFRWFREKHGMLGCIELTEPEYGGNYGYKLYYKLNHLCIDHWSKGYKTYEEVEDACIDKLIELIKQKQHEQD